MLIGPTLWRCISMASAKMEKANDAVAIPSIAARNRPSERCGFFLINVAHNRIAIALKTQY